MIDSSGVALYRKYRPQTLEDLIGQNHIKTTLKNAYLSNRLSHAYLFCGPKGTGKTSTARILAKMVNCEAANSSLQKPDGKNKIDVQQTAVSSPCNSCTSCLSITDGSNLDLIEIDAASNRGIDDIRELRDKIKLTPTSSLKKVYIIDEVHMLTNEAFNALLKTLEEPPLHVLFILATTDPQKIPQTILSRVQKLEFNQAAIADLLINLKKVAAGENLKIEDEVLEAIAKKADGSFRDALKILDQLASAGGMLNVQSLEELIKSGSFDESLRLLEAISLKNGPGCLEIIQSQVQNGINIKEYTLSLVDNLRMMLFIKNHALEVAKKELSSQNFESLVSLTDKFTNQGIINLLNLLINAQEKFKIASIASLPLEIAAVEACIKQETAIEAKSNLSISKETVDLTQKKEVIEEVIVPKPAIEETIPILSISSGTDDISNNGDLVKLMDKWTYILETIRPYNYSLEALLKQAKVLSCEDGLLILEVPYSFHQRILDAPKSRDLLESVVSDVLSKQIKIKTSLGQKPVLIEELANIEVAADDEIVQIAAEIFNSEPAN